MNVRIKLLGIPHIRVGTEDVKLPNRRVTLALLAYLVLRRGESLARSHVAFALWPDEEEERALSELRRYLYKLRRLFPGDGAGFIDVDDDTVSWNAAAPCTLDIADFERLASDPETVAEAIALYDGDLLEEVYDDWVIGERERLRGRFLTMLWSSIVAHRSRRAFAEAIAFAQRLLAADPWREDAVRQLMALRYESGDAAGALATYDRFTRALRAEMNAEPMPETVSLREAIVRGAPVPSGDAARGAEAPPRAQEDPLALPFVGREREYELLQRRWLAAAHGRGSLSVVVGDAGAGKSRLVSELALAADSGGGRVLTGATTSPEYRPYQALVDALRGAVPLLAAVDLAPPSLAALAELLPELRARRPDLPVLERLDPGAERSRLFDALAQVLVALARPRPVLLLLEDLHWAGAVTFEALAAIVPRVAKAAVAIVVTAREEEATRTHPLRELERKLDVRELAERVALGPLDRNAISELTAAAVPEGAAREAAAAAIFERSEGNALFATELLRDAASAGFAPPAIPRSLRAVIDERAAQLAPAARAFADVAAVLGTAFDLDLVCDVGGIALRDAEAALDELLERHVVRELSRRSRNDFAFTHQLVHAALYDAVDAQVRERRHRRVARVLDAPSAHARDERAAEIAYHYERGGDELGAAAAYLRAVRHAVSVFANAEARAWAERGIALARGDDALRFELLLAHSELVTRMGDRAAHESDLAGLRELAPNLGEDAVCTTLARTVEGCNRSEDRAAELAAIDELERVASAAGNRRWHAYAVLARGHHELALTRASSGLAAALEARKRYASLGDEEGVIRALALAASAASETGDAEAATVYAREARERAEQSGDARLRLNALRMEARAAQARQDPHAFAEVALATLALCRATGDRDAEAHAHYQVGSAYWSLWRVDEGVMHLRAALALFETLGSPRAEAARNNLAGFLLDLGCFEEAKATLEASLQAALASGSVDIVNHAACNLAEIAWMCGDAPEARAAADRALATLERSPPPRHVAVARLAEARALRCEARFAESLAEYERVAGIFSSISRAVDAADTRVEAASALLASGRAGEALAALEAVAAARREQPEFESQYPIRSRWNEACVRRAAGDADGARAALDAAARALAERTKAIGDPGLGAAFAAIPYHRAIGAARRYDRWPRFDHCVVAFAGRTAVETTR